MTSGAAAPPAERAAGRARLAILGSGTGTTAAALLAAQRRGEIRCEVRVVIGNNSAAGIFDVARTFGVAALHLSGRTHPAPGGLDGAILAALRAAEVDVVVLAGYMKPLGPGVLQAYEGRVVNTHPALLPDFGGHGMYGDRVHAAVLADGRTVTGATVHLVTAEYDAGPVLDQARVEVSPDDTVDTLRARVQAAEKFLLVGYLGRALAGWDGGPLRP